MKKHIIVLVAILALTVGCGESSSSSSNTATKAGAGKQIQAVATVGMVADLVRQVGGDHVSVRQICGTGVDPHLYTPTRDDVQDIMEAEIVFYCGLMLEGKMIYAFEKFGNSKPVAAITDGLDHNDLLNGDAPDPGGASSANSAHADPHVWNDVSMWSRCVERVKDELSALDPEHAETFAANADDYQQQLADLHAYGKRIVATIPEDSRLLVTSHDAFNYFGRAYGLDVTGVQGISTESEAGLQQINHLVDLLIDRQVKAVFVESSVSPKNVEALIEGAANRGQRVAKGGVLFSDAMGPAGTYEGSYIGMLDHNLTIATRALGGEADAGGMNGQLGQSPSGSSEH